MTSSMSSSVTQSTSQKSRKGRRRQIDLDTNADISDFNIRIACLSLILLHEDILVECSSPLAESPLSEQSVQKLKLMSDHYFTTVGVLNIGLGANDMMNAIKLMNNACHNHHLRLLAAPIILDGMEQRNTNGIQLRLSTTIGRFDFSEVLNNLSIPILSFFKYRITNQIRPDVKIVFNKIQRVTRNLIRRFAPPKTDINMLIGNCEIEFDISIIDRLNGLFNESPFAEEDNVTTSTPKKVELKRNNESKLDLTFESSSIDFRLRFPIADLRPIHDPQRVPWWERNVRPDFLLINFTQCKITANPALMRYEITANEIDAYYYENSDAQPNHMAKVRMHEHVGSRYKPGVIDYPKIVMHFPNDEFLAKNSPQSRTSDEESGPFSNESIGILNPNQAEQTPFTSRRICRESDTPHSKTSTDDAETLLIPGDRVEMSKFCDNAMKSAIIQIHITLPTVSLQLK